MFQLPCFGDGKPREGRKPRGMANLVTASRFKTQISSLPFQCSKLCCHGRGHRSDRIPEMPSRPIPSRRKDQLLRPAWVG